MTPPTLDFIAPPEPTPVAGNRAGGFTASGLTNTELGDRVEASLTQLGFQSALDGRRQGPFDVTYGDLACEVKACTRQAREYKVKPKKAEVERKQQAATEAGLRPATVMVVVDDEIGHVYWREGLGAFRLTPAFAYAGTVAL